MNLLLTCEHGGNIVLKQMQPFVKIPEEILNSHWAYDLGAIHTSHYFYKKLKKKYKVLFLKNLITRLLIDFNRSEDSPELFSKYTDSLPNMYKMILLKKYQKFRMKAFQFIQKSVLNKEWILHISIHTFTPVWNNQIRTTEIGILFDPARKQEKTFAELFKKDFTFKCDFNQPYSGISDGHTQSLRKVFKNYYVGIELEINQKFVNKNNQLDLKLKKEIYQKIENALSLFL